MKHLFIPYELALLANEKGFNEKCFGVYSGFNEELYMPSAAFSTPLDCPAPLYQQIIKWFEVEHSIEIYCPNYYKNNKSYPKEYECRVNGKQLSYDFGDSGSVMLFSIYEHAFNKAIEEAFKLI